MVSHTDFLTVSDVEFNESNGELFAFETRIRQMVTELIEPCVKRSLSERDLILVIQKQTEIMQRKVDECEFIV